MIEIITNTIMKKLKYIVTVASKRKSPYGLIDLRLSD